MNEIILATHNPHKAEEIAAILGETYSVKTMSDYGLTDEIVEDGETIEDNAAIKVRALEGMLPEEVRERAILMADDTGLFVDYLSGAPGVYSARYAGENCSFLDNNKKLIKALEGVPENQRGAHFSTAIAIIVPGGELFSVISKVDGKIKGELVESDSGFGYDPIFIEASTGKTYSEMGDKEKNNCSHRRQAVDQAVEVLEERKCE